MKIVGVLHKNVSVSLSFWLLSSSLQLCCAVYEARVCRHACRPECTKCWGYPKRSSKQQRSVAGPLSLLAVNYLYCALSVDWFVESVLMFAASTMPLLSWHKSTSLIAAPFPFPFHPPPPPWFLCVLYILPLCHPPFPSPPFWILPLLPPTVFSYSNRPFSLPLPVGNVPEPLVLRW